MYFCFLDNFVFFLLHFHHHHSFFMLQIHQKSGRECSKNYSDHEKLHSFCVCISDFIEIRNSVDWWVFYSENAIIGVRSVSVSWHYLVSLSLLPLLLFIMRTSHPAKKEKKTIFQNFPIRCILWNSLAFHLTSILPVASSFPRIFKSFPKTLPNSNPFVLLGQQKCFFD